MQEKIKFFDIKRQSETPTYTVICNSKKTIKVDLPNNVESFVWL